MGSRTLTADLQGELIDFLAWADRYVNQLDPLHPAPHDPDFQHERDFYYGSDENRFQKELQRFLGFTWQDSTKLESQLLENPNNPA